MDSAHIETYLRGLVSSELSVYVMNSLSVPNLETKRTIIVYKINDGWVIMIISTDNLIVQVDCYDPLHKHTQYDYIKGILSTKFIAVNHVGITVPKARGGIVETGLFVCMFAHNTIHPEWPTLKHWRNINLHPDHVIQTGLIQHIMKAFVKNPPMNGQIKMTITEDGTTTEHVIRNNGSAWEPYYTEFSLGDTVTWKWKGWHNVHAPFLTCNTSLNGQCSHTFNDITFDFRIPHTYECTAPKCMTLREIVDAIHIDAITEASVHGELVKHSWCFNFDDITQKWTSFPIQYQFVSYEAAVANLNEQFLMFYPRVQTTWQGFAFPF